MDLSAIKPHIHARRADALEAAVCAIEAGVAEGVVRNRDLVQAKEIINWSIEEATKAFLKEDVDDGSDAGADRSMWGRAYDANALIASFDAHNLPAFLRRARQHGGLTEYADFMESALLPLHALLKAAKPLVKKKGEAGHPPEPKTPEQIAREAAAMTCQCCGRQILANTGVIALHGYRRPGDGWQTASCDGAKFLPFEVSRDRLGYSIRWLQDWEARAVGSRNAVEAETKPILVRYNDPKADRWYGDRPKISVDITRANFDAMKAEHGLDGLCDFDRLKADDLERRDREIHDVRAEIKAQQARYDVWEQTHRWDAEAKEWAPIIATVAA
ncbi:hypothetical protein [Bradyrhizobium arachidis]|uniref:Uncharacterized protein n=1 Tax=Bradyrhizobium arachidis TaxID=858423 RepID=A0AAE7NPS5_9BRAD|nr:hypothetical protein [Bradyrhizobium arachidis]QOZ66409.1 hypothetical protein WN72_08330 [Bradyrhizobium arachidis]SFV18297.1 hypothetical protein SAMN05192541_13414 [Bradyrhizobium arachidis]